MYFGFMQDLLGVLLARVRLCCVPVGVVISVVTFSTLFLAKLFMNSECLTI